MMFYIFLDGEVINYGFGLVMDEIDGLKWVQYGGGINGFNLMFVYFLEIGVGVVVILNSNGFCVLNLVCDIVCVVYRVEVEIVDLFVLNEEQLCFSGIYVFEELLMEIMIVGCDD